MSAPMENLSVIENHSAEATTPTSHEQKLFDPYDHDQPDGIGIWDAKVLLVRCSIGASVLLMPYTTMRLGFVLTTLTMLMTGVVYFHIVHTLLAVEYRLCKRLRIQHLTYIELLTSVLDQSPAPFCRLRNGLRNLMYAYFCIPVGNALLLVAMANTVRDLGRYFDVELRLTAVITGLAVPLAAFCVFRRLLKILVPFSAATNAGTACMVALVVVESTLRPVASPNLWLFGDLTYVPMAAAICCEAFRCTTVILPIKKGMRQPRKLRGPLGALNWAAVAVVLTHCIFGALVYANYGAEVKANVLANMSGENRLLRVVEALYTLSLGVSYVLVIFSRFDTVWSGTLKQRLVARGGWYAPGAEYGLRVGLNVAAYALAIGLPNLDLVSVVSGTLSLALDIPLVAMMDLLSAHAEGALNGRRVVRNACVLCGSAVLFGVNLLGCVHQIVALYSTPPNNDESLNTSTKSSTYQ